MAEETATGNVAPSDGKTPVDIREMVMSWDADTLFPDGAQDVSEEDGETAEDATAEDDTEPSEAEGDETNNKPDMSGKETAGYKDGIAGALRYLTENKNTPPAVLKAVQNLQGEFTKVTTQQSDKARDLDAKLEKVETLLAQLEEPDDSKQANPYDPLNQVTTQQRQLFLRLAEELGFVRKEKISQREFIARLNKEAASTLGEEFGVVDKDTGEFQISPEARRIVDEEAVRLQAEDRGASHRDLYILAKFPELILKAKAEALEEYKAQQSGRATSRRNAETITQTRSPGYIQPRIKINKSDPNRFNKAMAQALALGFSAASKVP